MRCLDDETLGGLGERQRERASTSRPTCRSSIGTMRTLSLLTVLMPAAGEVLNAGSKGCGIVGMQYIVRKEEDMLSGALVSSTCGASGCTGSEEYTTGVLWAKKYYFLRAGLPNGLHLVDSCENARSQAVRVGPNAADATWYGVAVVSS